ncbi:hypothetical protein SD412_19285 [Bacteroides fragilis]|jgi:hypothetical protein
MNDLKFKKWLLGIIPSSILAVLGFFFKEPILLFLESRIYIPIYVFPLTVAGVLLLTFFMRWLLMFKNKELKFMRSIIKSGVSFGIKNGPSPVVAIEWSWLNPSMILAKTQNEEVIRVHYSQIILFV